MLVVQLIGSEFALGCQMGDQVKSINNTMHTVKIVVNTCVFGRIPWVDIADITLVDWPLLI